MRVTALTLRALSDLRSCMDADPRMAELRRAEELLRADPEALALFQKTDALREEFLKLRLELGPEDEQTLAAQRAFHQSKLKLDELPVAREYSRRFAEVNSLLRELDVLLFSPYRHSTPCGGTHD